MRSKLFAGTAAIAFLALSLAVAWYGIHKGHEAHDRLTALAVRKQDLEAAIKQAEGKIGADMRAGARLQEAGRAPATKAAPAVWPAGEPQLAVILSHPQLIQAFMAYFRASLSQRFDIFYREAGMSPDQIAKFEDLMTKHQADQMDLAAAASSQGLDSADPASAALRQQQNGQFRADLTALLGDGTFSQLQQYNRAQGAMAIVQGAATLSLDSEPYSNAQAGQLMQVVANASPSYRQGGAVDPSSVDWDSVLNQAGSILSPAQTDALKALVGQMHLMVLVHNYYAQPKK